MIIQTTKEINGVVYDYAYSDSGFMIERDGVGYTTRCRLIADEGKILTNGDTETFCIDVDSADGWTEIDAPIEGSKYE